MSERNKPIFRGLTPHSSTVSAYCPKCDKEITHFYQERCLNCNIVFNWNVSLFRVKKDKS